LVLSNKKFNIVNEMTTPEQTPLQKYIDRLVDLVAQKEGGCSRLRKPTKVEFWVHRPNYTTVVTVDYTELERCMMVAGYPEHLRKYIE
jgi:hypothetical protein